MTSFIFYYHKQKNWPNIYYRTSSVLILIKYFLWVIRFLHENKIKIIKNKTKSFPHILMISKSYYGLWIFDFLFPVVVEGPLVIVPTPIPVPEFISTFKFFFSKLATYDDNCSIALISEKKLNIKVE